jgi:hypothetical protein
MVFAGEVVAQALHHLDTIFPGDLPFAPQFDELAASAVIAANQQRLPKLFRRTPKFELTDFRNTLLRALEIKRVCGNGGDEPYLN